ncbi:hypothetical protein D3C81_1142430 [compost metagenome]
MRRPVTQAAHAFGAHPQLQQRKAHGGVQVDGVGSGDRRMPGGAHLATLQCVVTGQLPSRFGVTQPLQADVQPGGIHHHEHGRQATVRLPHQPALGPLEAQRTGGAAANAQLVLQAIALHPVAHAPLQPVGHQQQ